jgi:hypothetical protein
MGRALCVRDLLEFRSLSPQKEGFCDFFFPEKTLCFWILKKKKRNV